MTVRIAGLQLPHRFAVIVKLVRIAATKPTTGGQQAGRVVPLVAGVADFLLHTNYGFLAAKPSNASVIDFLSPWPWYIPELVGIGLLSLLIYYTPFLIWPPERRPGKV